MKKLIYAMFLCAFCFLNERCTEEGPLLQESNTGEKGKTVFKLKSAPSGYIKVWEDNFDGPGIDTVNWVVGTLRDPVSGHIVPGAAGDHLLNSGYCGYVTAEDSYIENGALVLRNQKRTYTGTSPAGTYDYTSSWVMSMHRVFLNKGYIEIRAKFPSGDKVWPALWLIAEDRTWGPEWDMFEYFGYRGDVGYDNMGLHLCYGEWPNEQWSSGWISGYDAIYDCEAWHVYGFEWTADHATWYIDGNPVRTLSSSGISAWPDEDMYIVLNNGQRTSSPDNNTTWPNYLVIDYIEVHHVDPDAPVWQKVDDRDIAVSYDANWGQYNGNPGYLATETYSEIAGGTAIFSFNGTQARYRGFKRNDLGFADIYVDDVFQTTIDCYSGLASYDVLLYETAVLPDGDHTLKVVVNGGNNPSSSGFEVICDAFEVIGAASQGGDMFVSDISFEPLKRGPNYYVIAHVTVKNDVGQVIEGATVNAAWGSSVSGNVSGATGPGGMVSFESSKVKNGGTFTITVTDVQAPGYTYNPSLNIETSDSVNNP